MHQVRPPSVHQLVQEGIRVAVTPAPPLLPLVVVHGSATSPPFPCNHGDDGEGEDEFESVKICSTEIRGCIGETPVAP